MTEPSGHLDLDTLADVLAGERDDVHVRSCLPCADRLAELAAADAAVTAALGALPAPPVPDGLVLRLSRALQQERRQEVAPVRPLRRRAPAWLPAAAASAVLVTAGAVGWSELGLPGQGSGDEASTEAASDADGGSGQDTAAAPEAASGLALPAPATDWADGAGRQAALSRLLAGAGAPAGGTGPAPAGDALDRLRDPAALAGCLGALPGGDDDVLAVDYALYAGAPAVAFVQPADPGSVEVTVVGSDCSADDPDLLGSVVLPRP